MAMEASMGEVAAKQSDHSLCLQYRAGQKALETLIERHGGLVRSWAKRMRRPEQCCSLQDLVQEAQRGLIDAASRFDPQRGSFSTVAVLWIKKRIFKQIEKSWQHGPQTDRLDQQTKAEKPAPDRQRLLQHFGKIEQLAEAGVIDEVDVVHMRAICSDEATQEELLKPVFATWWRAAQRRTLKRVAAAIQIYRPGKKPKANQRRLW